MMLSERPTEDSRDTALLQPTKEDSEFLAEDPKVVVNSPLVSEETVFALRRRPKPNGATSSVEVDELPTPTSPRPSSGVPVLSVEVLEVVGSPRVTAAGALTAEECDDL